jgi:hypothetical protein
MLIWNLGWCTGSPDLGFCDFTVLQENSTAKCQFCHVCILPNPFKLTLVWAPDAVHSGSLQWCECAHLPFYHLPMSKSFEALTRLACLQLWFTLTFRLMGLYFLHVQSYKVIDLVDVEKIWLMLRKFDTVKQLSSHLDWAQYKIVDSVATSSYSYDQLIHFFELLPSLDTNHLFSFHKLMDLCYMSGNLHLKDK